MLIGMFVVGRSLLKGNYLCCSPAPLNRMDTAFIQILLGVPRGNSVNSKEDSCLNYCSMYCVVLMQ